MFGEKMVMVNSVSMAAERRALQVMSGEGESPRRSQSPTNTTVPQGRNERVARSSSESSDEGQRFQRIERKKQKGKERAIDSGASSASGGDTESERTHSDDLPSGGRSLGSADTNAGNDALEDQADSQEMEADPDYIPTKTNNDVENAAAEDVGAEPGEMEATTTTTEPMSALLAFSTLDLQDLTPRDDGYFYDRENVRYVRTTGNEGNYVYERTFSILESTVSPTFSEPLSSPIARSMVDRALEYASPPPLNVASDPSVHDEVEAVGRGEPEDLTFSSEVVVETPDATM
jgi:hypothetical protein